MVRCVRPPPTEDIEKTEVVVGLENVIDRTLQSFTEVTEKFDNCTDSTYPIVLTSVEIIRKAYRELRDRGIKIRFITEITNENVQFVKEIFDLVSEVRHLDGVKGNLAILDSRLLGVTATVSATKAVEQLVISNVRALVEQQQYFFDMLWKKAIPAKQRIKEIEENLKREFIETIRDTDETASLISKVLSSATEEILMIFSHANTLKQYEKLGMLYIVRKKAEKEVPIRILIGTSSTIYDRDLGWLNEYRYVELRPLQKSLQTRLTTIVTDRELSLVVEEKDSLFHEDNLGLATYSNSDSTVLSYASLFENLWAQSASKSLQTN